MSTKTNCWNGRNVKTILDVNKTFYLFDHKWLYNTV